MPQEGGTQEKATVAQPSAVQVAKKTKTESGSGSEKENGHKRTTETPKKKKRKILDSDDSDDNDDDDEDYSPKKTAAKKAAKEVHVQTSTTSNEVKKVSSALKSQDKPKESKPKLNSFKLVPGSHNNHISKDNSAEGIKNILNGNMTNGNSTTTTTAATTPNPTGERENVSKLFPKSINKMNNATTGTPLATPCTTGTPTKTTTATPSLSLAQKIEVSTPKGGTFDVLGSIMKDMTK